MTTVFLGFGGNIGDTLCIFETALALLAQIEGVNHLKASRTYTTSPVSTIDQRDYLNLVCSLTTSLSAVKLFEKIQEIEMQLGKIPKPKNMPRIIDIDLLFYGTQKVNTDKLTIPHPRWDQRIFVLAPLLELTDTILGIEIKQLIKKCNPLDWASPLP